MGYNTSTTYNGDGVTTDFAIPFTYVDTADIVVTRQNGSVTWSLPSSNMVRLSLALASGDKLTIQRNTSLSTPKTVFKNATTVTGGNMNSIMTQMFNATQESADISLNVSTSLAAINTAVATTTANAAAAATSAANAAMFDPSSFYTKTVSDGKYQLITGMSSYVTTTSFSSTLSSYVTTSNLTTTLGSYVTTSNLTTTLGSYTTTSALTTALSSYLTTASASSTYTPKDVGSLGIGCMMMMRVASTTVNDGDTCLGTNLTTMYYSSGGALTVGVAPPSGSTWRNISGQQCLFFMTCMFQRIS